MSRNRQRAKWTLRMAAALLFMVGGAACTNINPTATVALPTDTLAALATFTPRYTATPVITSTPRPITSTPTETPVPPTPSNTFTPSPTPPVVGQVSSVQVVNLREGPGTSFDIIQGVPSNTEVIILASDEEQGWYNVRLEDGTEGWIAADLINVRPSATPEPSNTPPGMVLEVSGTPVATSLLGGQPITATPSDTPASPAGQRTPGTVTATPSQTLTPTPGAGIPTVTPGSGATSTPSWTPVGSTSAPASVQPSTGNVDILAYCEQFNEVPSPLAAGATVDVFWGWIAASREFIQQHLDNVIYEVQLDGSSLTNWRQYATNIRQRDNGDWEIYWYVPVGELGRGRHTISYRVTWRAAISDGYREFGPGTPTEFESGSCTFEIR